MELLGQRTRRIQHRAGGLQDGRIVEHREDGWLRAGISKPIDIDGMNLQQAVEHLRRRMGCLLQMRHLRRHGHTAAASEIQKAGSDLLGIDGVGHLRSTRPRPELERDAHEGPRDDRALDTGMGTNVDA